MNFGKTLLASVALAASLGAQAQVTGGLGALGNDFFGLSAPQTCTIGSPCTMTATGVTGTIVGGTILASDQPFADIPKGGVVGGLFLSAGPTTTEPSSVSFSAGLKDISFLWGSPDLYNKLTVVTTAGNVFFDVTSLGFSVTNGDQSFSQYVNFVADAGVSITGLLFTNNPSIDAFEVANFNHSAGQIVTVPEPETYALMLAGLGAVGFIGRRRRRQA